MTERQAPQQAPLPLVRSKPGNRRRPGKAALQRTKLAAIALSVVAFVGTLAGISRTGAPTSQAALAAAPAPVVAPARQHRSFNSELQAPVKPAPFAMPAIPQGPSMRAFGRTRGS